MALPQLAKPRAAHPEFDGIVNRASASDVSGVGRVVLHSESPLKSQGPRVRRHGGAVERFQLKMLKGGDANQQQGLERSPRTWQHHPAAPLANRARTINRVHTDRAFRKSGLAVLHDEIE